MGGGSADPITYLSAAGIAAVLNFPLWKAATIGQSGFAAAADSLYARMRILFGPPYRGVAATMFGMTWARAAIFYCSDFGKELLLQRGTSTAAATSLPAIAISTVVQVVNQPIVRGTITIQDPKSSHPNLSAALVHIYRTRGVAGLWHGTSASVLKTVPKYVTAIWVKDMMHSLLPAPSAPVGTVEHRSQVIRLSAAKSIAAGVAGAALTNPLDVIRNEMFKTEQGPLLTTNRLFRQEGFSFVYRGMARNIFAVAVPIGLTIFLTDTIMLLRAKRKLGAEPSVPPPVSGDFKLQHREQARTFSVRRETAQPSV